MIANQQSPKEGQASISSQDESSFEQNQPAMSEVDTLSGKDKTPISKVVPVTSPLASPVTSTSTSAVTEFSQSGKKILICPHCNEKFSGGVNLGGHISKKHKGMSASYNRKMQTRESNTQRREQRAEAKRLIRETIGRDCEKRFRVFITQLTNLLVEKVKAREAYVLAEIDQK